MLDRLQDMLVNNKKSYIMFEMYIRIYGTQVGLSGKRLID